MKLEMFSPQSETVDAEVLLHTLTSRESLRKPFAPELMEFCSAFSKELFRVKGFPEITALAYWLRRSHIESFQNDFRFESPGLAVPRGLVFHIAPANVDTMAIYSWVLSFLTGNSNCVRISSRKSETSLIIFRVLQNLFSQEAFRELQDTTAFVSYPHNDAVTKLISSYSDLRMIWGGDATVAAIRAIPAKLQSIDLGFRNRESLAVIDCHFYLRQNAHEKSTLADRFFNDLFLFDQKGCSSPRFIFWVGSPSDCENARLDFFAHIEATITRKKFSFSLSQRLDRLSHVFCEASSATGRHFHHSAGTLATIEMSSLSDKLAEHPGNGLLCEYAIESLVDLSTWIDERIQTLSYFGFSADDFENLVASLKGRGLDRIVPIGQALDFSPLWDGYDLFDYLVKRVDRPRSLASQTPRSVINPEMSLAGVTSKP